MEYAFEPLVGYRSEKAAQVSANFLRLAAGRMDKLKLIKLLYLFERESAARRGRLALFDEYYSLKHGPVCSSSLNALNGNLDEAIWSKYISRHGKKDVYLNKNVSRDHFDQISRSDQHLIEGIWERFSWMTASQIRNWTHENCPEYTEVEEGRIPIKVEMIAEAVGVDPNDFEASVDEYRSASAVMVK